MPRTSALTRLRDPVLSSNQVKKHLRASSPYGASKSRSHGARTQKTQATAEKTVTESARWSGRRLERAFEPRIWC
jgi:hypothetical protein